jgi:hypothetical protein
VQVGNVDGVHSTLGEALGPVLELGTALGVALGEPTRTSTWSSLGPALENPLGLAGDSLGPALGRSDNHWVPWVQHWV